MKSVIPQGILQFMILYFVSGAMKHYVEKTLEEGLRGDNGTGCDIPELDPYSEEILAYHKPSLEIVCGRMNWVNCYLLKCKVHPKILKMVTNVKCLYRDIMYVTDKWSMGIRNTVLSGAEEYNLIKSDFVAVFCEGKFHDSTKSWSGRLAGLREVNNGLPRDREKGYNVLIFGFGSLSKNGFIRHMPKSYEFIKNIFRATIFNGYNIIGDGSLAAILPILTGNTAFELNSGTTDTTPLIFSKLKNNGYRTAYFDDMLESSSFQTRFDKILKQSTDHYMRPFFQAYRQFPSAPFCVGDTPQYQLMMNLTDQFFRLNGKKFAFTFMGDKGHDSFNPLDVSDMPLVKFLEGLSARGVMHNTLVIIMGDHGPRYNNQPKAFQGNLEERLPFMAIRLPDELVVKNPATEEALDANSDVLTTPHDIYATVLDILDMKQHWNMYKVKGAALTRGLTVLEPIPKTRSCSEAGIEPHWCSCVKWEEFKNDHYMFTTLALELLDYINSITDFLREKCAVRTLVSIDRVVKSVQNNKPLNLSKQLATQVYQIQITVGPSLGKFEATITHLTSEDKFVINEIYRTNAYNNEPSCLNGEHPRLLPFCYCIPEMDYEYN